MFHALQRFSHGFVGVRVWKVSWKSNKSDRTVLCTCQPGMVRSLPLLFVAAGIRRPTPYGRMYFRKSVMGIVLRTHLETSGVRKGPRGRTGHDLFIRSNIRGRQSFDSRHL